jgi:hypothetical protein
METEQVNLTLTPHGAELLRAMRKRRPGLSPAEIVEEALSKQMAREADKTAPAHSSAEVRAWLDELASISDKIPARPNETFRRDMIYQDHS